MTSTCVHCHVTIAYQEIPGFGDLWCRTEGPEMGAAVCPARDDDGHSPSTLRLTGTEREALLRAWPWPKEAATTEGGFGAEAPPLSASPRPASRPPWPTNPSACVTPTAAAATSSTPRPSTPWWSRGCPSPRQLRRPTPSSR